MERDFKGVWIPKEIYLNKELSWSEKILLVEIDSLDNERGCFASNPYFSEFLGVSETRISKMISKLKKLEYIKQESFNGRERILKSNIKVLDLNKSSKQNEVDLNKSSKQDSTKVQSRQEEKFKHNNIANKTFKNIYTKEIYDYWILKAKHINNAKYTDSLEKEIDKATKKYSKDNILKAIDNYTEVFDSNYYYSASFTLMNFLKQGNCIPRFIEGVDEKYNGDIYKGYKIKFPSIANMDKPYWSNIDS